MKTAFIIAAIVVVLLILDRLALWMESRGWIYWRRSKGSGGGSGPSLLELNIMGDPGARHIHEARDVGRIGDEEARAGGDD